jgi:hypothetical protein
MYSGFSHLSKHTKSAKREQNNQYEESGRFICVATAGRRHQHPTREARRTRAGGGQLQWEREESKQSGKVRHASARWRLGQLPNLIVGGNQGVIYAPWRESER